MGGGGHMHQTDELFTNFCPQRGEKKEEMLDYAFWKIKGGEKSGRNKNYIRYTILQSVGWYEVFILSRGGTRRSTPPKTRRWQRHKLAFPFGCHSSIVTEDTCDKRMYCCHWRCHYGTVNKRRRGGLAWNRPGPEGHEDNLEWKDARPRGGDKTPLRILRLIPPLWSQGRAYA